MHPGAGNYFGLMQNSLGKEKHPTLALLQGMFHISWAYIYFMPSEIAGYENFSPAYLLPLIVCPLTVIGCIAMLRSRQLLIPVVWLLYHGALLLVPYFEPRYYLPVLPLFLCLFWEGAKYSYCWARSKGIVPGAFFVYALGLCPMLSLLCSYFSTGQMQVTETKDLDWISAACLLAIAVGLGYASERSVVPCSWRVRPFAATLIGIFLALAALRSFSENLVRERNLTPENVAADWRDLHAAAAWLKIHSNPNETVISARTSLIWFWTGHQGYSVPNNDDRALIASRVKDVNWAIVDSIPEDGVAYRFLLPLLISQPNEWEAVWFHDRTSVFKRTTGGPGSGVLKTKLD